MALLLFSSPLLVRCQHWSPLLLLLLHLALTNKKKLTRSNQTRPQMAPAQLISEAASYTVQLCSFPKGTGASSASLPPPYLKKIINSARATAMMSRRWISPPRRKTKSRLAVTPSKAVSKLRLNLTRLSFGTTSQLVTRRRILTLEEWRSGWHCQRRFIRTRSLTRSKGGVREKEREA